MSPRHGVADRVPPPRREREHHPSFSAALLDAIYHSLDGDDADLRRANVSPDEMPPPPPCRHRRSTASSPSASSARSSPRSQRPPRPCRVRPHPQPPSLLLPPPTPAPPPGDGEDAKAKYMRRRKRRTTRFACLLNALLCNRKPPAASSSPANAATATPRAPLPAIRAEPASARSILSRRESVASAPGGGGFLQQTPGRRAVRFSPAVEIVGDEDLRGCGAMTAAIRLREVGGSGAEAPRESAAEAERRVEELLRALGAAEERERTKESSESSSDLFELDTLPAALDGGIGLPRTARAAGLAPPRPRVLVDDMVV